MYYDSQMNNFNSILDILWKCFLLFAFRLGWVGLIVRTGGSNSLVVCKAAVKMNCVLVVLRLWFGGE